MTRSMAEVVAAVQRAISELSRHRAEALAAVEAARSARSRAAAATEGTSRDEPGEALNTVAEAILDAENAAARFASTANHLRAYLAKLEGGSGDSGAGLGGSADTSITTSTAVEPAGKWVPIPGGQRSFGDDFNRRYEEWVRTITGGPAAGSEYLVEANGEKVHFDATMVETRNGRPTEVLIDAKGRYAQFVDKKTGKFYKFFQGTPGKGVDGMMDDAIRQVAAADGRPIEWWFAEEDAADAFERKFDRDEHLNGRIEAVHKPMPE